MSVRNTLIARSLVAAAACILAGGAGTALAAPQGPPGRAFYSPPHPLPGKHPGDLIRWRALDTGARLPAASRNLLILYRSDSVQKKPTAVSGTVAIPKGKPPKGGWPVISWAHGTSGGGDACAPSLDRPGHHPTGDIPYTNKLLNRWVKAGYVVLRTDYEGLGTPGVHPLLNGAAEARGVVDIARAARQLDRHIGRRWLIAGHSQGGQAGLFAGALATRRAPELDLRGVAVFAPVSHLRDVMNLLLTVHSPTPLAAYGGLAIRPLLAIVPQLHIRSRLTKAANKLLPDVDRKCLDALQSRKSWGGLAPSDIFKSGASAKPVLDYIARHGETEALTIPVPVQIEQGTDDTTVFKGWTDDLVDQYRQRGMNVDYHAYDGATHHGVLAAGWPDATAFANARLAVDPR